MIEQVQSRQRICLWKTTLRIRLCPLHSNNALKQKKRQGDNNNNRIYYFLCKVFNIATRFKCLTLAQTLQTCIKYIEVGWSKFCLLVTVMLIWTFQMRYQFVFISCDYRAAWRRKSPAVIEIKDMPNSCRLSSNKKKEIF